MTAKDWDVLLIIFLLLTIHIVSIGANKPTKSIKTLLFAQSGASII
jgi:hypothetical protein